MHLPNTCIRKILLPFSIALMAVAQLNAQVTITGNVQKSQGADHTGITISFQMVAPGDDLYAVNSETNGDFTAEIALGKYDITFSAPGFKDNWLINTDLFSSQELPGVVLFNRGRIIYHPGEFPSIQQALDFCNSEDTILVAQGTYQENLVLPADKNYVLGSEFLVSQDTSFISNTIIDGGEVDRVIRFNEDNIGPIEIIGLSITNGFHASESGGGLYLKNNGQVSIRNCRIYDNIVGNSETDHAPDGAGIYIGYCDSIEINNCRIYNNQALTRTYVCNRANCIGGGIYILSGNEIEISESVIINNVVYGCPYGSRHYGKGGGIAAISVNMKINRCIISNNYSNGTGGGLHLESYNTDSISITNTIISGNEAEQFGGGLSYESINSGGERVLDMVNCLIADNITSQAETGALEFYNSSNLSPDAIDILNCIFYSNLSSVEIRNDYQEGYVLFPLHLRNNCFEEGSSFTGVSEWVGDFTNENLNGDSVDVYGNLFKDPDLLDPSAGDYSPRRTSPAIDAGLEDMTGLNIGLVDIRNQPRISNNIIDIGPYEYQTVSPVPLVSNEVVCVGEEVPGLVAIGDSIRWYSDPELTDFLYMGDSFQTGQSEPGIYTYWVTQTRMGTESDPAEVVLEIKPGPGSIGEVTGAIQVCQGQEGVAYSIEPAQHADNYNWLMPVGFDLISGEGSTEVILNYQPTAEEGLIAVFPENDCGTGDTAELLVMVDPLPMATGGITGFEQVCPGAEVAYEVQEMAGAERYQWTLPEGVSIVGDPEGSQVILSFGQDAISGNIGVTGLNHCGPGDEQVMYVSVEDLAEPGKTGPINGPEVICETDEFINLAVQEVAGATDYAWTLPEGVMLTAGAGSNEVTVSISAAAHGKPISARGFNACYEGEDSDPFVIDMKSLPEPAGVISGKSEACPGTTEFYEIAPITGADSYTWMLPPGFEGNSTLESIEINISKAAGSGAVSVSGSNECGDGQEAAININIVPPIEPNLVLKGNYLLICTDSTNFDYQWYLDGNPLSGENRQFLVLEGLAGGDFHLEITDDAGCVSSSTAIPFSQVKKSKIQLTLFPNPLAGHTMTCRISASIEEEATWEILEPDGTKLRNGTIYLDMSPVRQEFSTEYLAPGTYYLRISGEKNGTITQAIIIL